MEGKNVINISIFDYENKEKHPIYVSKNCYEENMLIYFDKRRRQKTLRFFLRFKYFHG